jgi:hypothetical protein
MNNSKNYPSFWKMDMSVQMPEGASHQPMWEDWTVQQDVSCPWQPESFVTSRNYEGAQTASWETWRNNDDKDNTDTADTK